MKKSGPLVMQLFSILAFKPLGYRLRRDLGLPILQY